MGKPRRSASPSSNRHKPPTPTAQEMIERVHKHISDRVKRLRSAKNKSRNELKEYAEVGSDRIKKIELAKYGPEGWSLCTICRVADALDADLRVEIISRTKNRPS